GLIGAGLSLWKEGLPALGEWWGERTGDANAGKRWSSWAFPEEFPLFPGGRGILDRLTIGFEGSLIMLAAGAIMGIRVGVSLLIGAIVYFGIVGEWLVSEKIVTPGYRGIVSWTLWPATAMMVTSGLLSFALKWRTVMQAFRGLTRLVGQEGTAD